VDFRSGWMNEWILLSMQIGRLKLYGSPWDQINLVVGFCFIRVIDIAPIDF